MKMNVDRKVEKKKKKQVSLNLNHMQHKIAIISVVLKKKKYTFKSQAHLVLTN